jgi:hypothetical protein
LKTGSGSRIVKPAFLTDAVEKRHAANRLLWGDVFTCSWLGTGSRQETRESENLEFAFRFNRNANSSAIVNSFDRVQHRARHATYPCHVARRSDMSIVKRLGTVAVAAVLAIALMAPTGAQARNGRIAAGGEAVGGVFWGPSPPYYPYYHFGYYGVPVWGPGPFWGPYEYGCYRQAVSTDRHGRRVRVCD